MNKATEIANMKAMMKSIFAYETLTRGDKYLNSFRNKLSEVDFNATYDSYVAYLSDTYSVTRNVYIDFEGCTYNSLELKQ